jgi:hypothetical protein
MRSIKFGRFQSMAGGTFAAMLVVATIPWSQAQQQLSDPIYRVANDTSAVQPAGGAAGTTEAAGVTPAPPTAAPAAPAAGAKGFDLTQKPGEHPLAPVLRVVKASQEEFDRTVKDYNCTFVKQERLEGELAEKQFIMLKLMEKPFSVYMNFLQPYAGREVCFVDGQNEGKAVVREAGFKRNLGKLKLDPTGSLMMKGQKRPVTDVGIRNLMIKLSKMWEAETKFAECEVTTDADSKIDGRSTTMIMVTHPIERKEFKFHIARLFIDNEHKIPIHFDGYLWPAQQGNGDGNGNAAGPPLEESYTYQNLKLNNGYTAREFDAYNNPDIFK